MGFWNRRHRGNFISAQDAGCFERHLQRRRENPLFPRGRQDVSGIEIQEARQRDNGERSALKSQIVEVLRPLMEGPDVVGGLAAVDLLQQIHQVIELVYKSDQGLEQEVATLQRGYESLSESMRIGRSSEQHAQLDVAARTLRQQIVLLSAPLMATLSRPDSPMRSDELVPSILGLPVGEIRRCLGGIRTLPSHSLPLTVSQAIQLITWASSHAVRIPDADEKLRLLEEVGYDAG